MRHLGDITKISGYEAPPVDCIIGGSPCQDLSVAGKRAGLKHSELGDEETTRSGLFMEQVRILKEMKVNAEIDGRTDRLGRFMVWENVPGAFSSGQPKGADFQAVLEELVKVCDKEAPLVPIPKNGWPDLGCLMGRDGLWSLAWRVVDGQYFGTPQRRRRIALVLDTRGAAAPKILFECKGLPGHTPSGFRPWQTAAGASAESPAETGSTAWDGGNISSTLTSSNAGGGQRMPDKQNFTCVLSESDGTADG